MCIRDSGHSDYENAMIECNAAVRRTILDSHDIVLIRLFSDVPEFRQWLHREVADETYPKLHELLRPLSQEDIDLSLIHIFRMMTPVSRFVLRKEWW